MNIKRIKLYCIIPILFGILTCSVFSQNQTIRGNLNVLNNIIGNSSLIITNTTNGDSTFSMRLSVGQTTAPYTLNDSNGVSPLFQIGSSGNATLKGTLTSTGQVSAVGGLLISGALNLGGGNGSASQIATSTGSGVAWSNAPPTPISAGFTSAGAIANGSGRFNAVYGTTDSSAEGNLRIAFSRSVVATNLVAVFIMNTSTAPNVTNTLVLLTNGVSCGFTCTLNGNSVDTITNSGTQSFTIPANIGISISRTNNAASTSMSINGTIQFL